MPKTVTFGNVTVAPGEVGKGYLGTVELADGSRPPVPVMIANGAADGPTLVVTAAVHGTEVSCSGAVHRLMKTLDPRAMKGKVIAVPAANPIAVTHGSYTSWVDGMNMSQAWERASKDGSLTERMAAMIWPAIDTADCFVDLHANPLPCIAFTVATKTADEETFRLARSFGVTMVKHGGSTAINYQGKGLRQILAERGVPAFSAELTGNIFYWDDLAEQGARGVRNVMRALNILDGDPEPFPDLVIVEGDLEFSFRPRANRGGLVRGTAAPGTRLKKGATALEIYNLIGDLVEEIKMPHAGYFWSFSTGAVVSYSSVVSEGQTVGYVFKDAND